MKGERTQSHTLFTHCHLIAHMNRPIPLFYLSPTSRVRSIFRTIAPGHSRKLICTHAHARACGDRSRSRARIREFDCKMRLDLSWCLKKKTKADRCECDRRGWMRPTSRSSRGRAKYKGEVRVRSVMGFRCAGVLLFLHAASLFDGVFLHAHARVRMEFDFLFGVFSLHHADDAHATECGSAIEADFDGEE